MLPMKKHEPDVIDNKNNSYSNLSKEKVKNTDKKIYKFIDTNLFDNNNKDTVKQTENIQDEDSTTTGNFYIIKYFGTNC